jgi:hypothetical protein
LTYKGIAEWLAITLTTGADNLSGTSNNDTISGAVINAGGSTFSLTDIIDGGPGTDTLSIVSDTNFTVVGSNVKNIEKYSVNSTAATVVTLSNVTGYSELVNNASSAALTFGNGAAGGVSGNQTLTINGATGNTTLVYSDTALTGSADSLVVNLTNYGTSSAARVLTAGANTAAANELETLTINATGTNAITLTTNGIQTSLKTVTLTGAGNLSLGLADNIATSATTINASAATGNVTIGSNASTLGAANHNVTLGSGNDSVFFGANLNISDTVDGGTGTDTLGVSAALTNAIMTNVKGFEVVRFNLGGNITQDAGISSLSAINSFVASGANTLTLNNLANNSSVNVVGDTTTVTQVLKDSSGLNDALTLTVTNGASNAATTLGTLTAVTGLETLNVVSTGGTGTNVITNLNATAKLVITGSAGLEITNAVASSQVDAAALTGKLTVIGQASAATNIQSGSGADTITLGTAADTVNAGAGNDVIILGSTGVTTFGADVITTGAGNDTIRFSATAGASAATTTYGTFATITDFTVGTSTSASDFLQFSAADGNFGATGAGGAVTGLAKGATAAGLAATNAMVVQSLAQNATSTLTTDVSLVKLTTGVAFTTDIATTAKAAIGTGSVTNLAQNGVYLVSFYDTTNSKMVIVTANTGTSANNDTTLSTADFDAGTNASVHVVGVINMSATDYAAFSAVNLAAAV